MIEKVGRLEKGFTCQKGEIIALTKTRLSTFPHTFSFFPLHAGVDNWIEKIFYAFLRWVIGEEAKFHLIS